MKKLIFTSFIAMTVAFTACQDQSNPLLNPPATPHQTPAFNEIKLSHYEPAVDIALEEARKNIAAIINNPEAPTFENTIVALTTADEDLDRITTIFFALMNAETSDEMNEIATRLQSKLVEFSNDISLDPVLFDRIEKVYESRNELGLNKEDAMLLEKTYKGFVRSGAALNEQDKERYREISSELSQLSLQYGRNVLTATNAFSLNIPPADEHKIAELPEFVKESMRADAQERDQEGWTVTLHAASVNPFMSYSSDRELKEKLWREGNSLCMQGGETDNQEAVKRITELRLEMANLLGYPTYADYVLAERMAGDVETVYSFLDELLSSTKKYGEQDVTELQKYAIESELYGRDFKLMPWDFRYVSEKYKNEKYAISNEEIKPYLELENVKKGIFMLTEKLYGVHFVANPDIQVYHPDVVAYEAYEEDGTFIGVIYMDFFPRASKRSGAWMTNFRSMYTREDGTKVHPLISMCGNFTKPTETTPSLLTFMEFETFLHEFGHCLHGLFAEGKYVNLTGASVYRDFVELPSQLMENWATEKEFLDMFAVHYETGEKMPQELIDKIIASKNYLAAYNNTKQIQYGLLDMAWHTITTPVTESVEAFEYNATKDVNLMPNVPGVAMSPSFSHIFSGGYASGYYGYKWAEVLETDAFSLFEEKGIFNREVAGSFRKNILSKGGSEHPMDLYVRFRGHEPQTQALIDRITKQYR